MRLGTGLNALVREEEGTNALSTTGGGLGHWVGRERARGCPGHPSWPGGTEDDRAGEVSDRVDEAHCPPWALSLLLCRKEVHSVSMMPLPKALGAGCVPYRGLLGPHVWGMRCEGASALQPDPPFN